MPTATTTRTIPLVLASEQPVPVFDPFFGATVNEVLKVDGIEFGDRVPLVDSHQRQLSHVLGSIRDLRVVGTELRGVAHFASGTRASEVHRLYADGHLSDFSIGAQRLEIERQENGDRVVTRSRLIEGSAVVAGADSNARAISKAARRQQRREQLDIALRMRSLRELSRLVRLQESGDYGRVFHDPVIGRTFRRLCREKPDVDMLDHVASANAIVAARREYLAQEKRHAREDTFRTPIWSLRDCG